MAGPMNGVYGGGAMMMDGGNDKRGQKRVASDSDLSDLQRFEKRLRALSIKNDETSAEKNSKPIFHKRVPSKPGVLATGFKRSPPPTTPHHARGNDGMQIDDTRDRVYIADLDAELADASSPSDDEKLIFLPDIERRFNRLPRQVYEPTASPDHGPQELVLYSDPKSLSVAEGHDSVRKAVVEARQRARERAAAESRLRQEDMERSYSAANTGRWGAINGDGVVETAHGYGDAGYISPLRLDHDAETDPDAMDIG